MPSQGEILAHQRASFETRPTPFIEGYKAQQLEAAVMHIAESGWETAGEEWVAEYLIEGLGEYYGADSEEPRHINGTPSFSLENSVFQYVTGPRESGIQVEVTQELTGSMIETVYRERYYGIGSVFVSRKVGTIFQDRETGLVQVESPQELGKCHFTSPRADLVRRAYVFATVSMIEEACGPIR